MIKWWQKIKKALKVVRTPKKPISVNLTFDGKTIFRSEISR